MNNNLNRRKSKTVQRENQLRTLIYHFYDLFRDEQISSAVSTAYSIGMINKKQFIIYDDDEAEVNADDSLNITK